MHLDYIQGLYRVGQVEQAIKQCQKALVVLPDHPELQYRLAWLIMNQDKPDDLHLFYATEQLVRACNKAKKSNYFQLLAQVYQKTDRLELAKGAAKKANQTFILEQRADMRARLVQVAIQGQLIYSTAALAGFDQTGASLFPDELEENDCNV